MSENIYISHFITKHKDILMSKDEDTLPICRTSSGLLAYNLKNNHQGFGSSLINKRPKFKVKKK